MIKAAANTTQMEIDFLLLVIVGYKGCWVGVQKKHGGLIKLKSSGW